MPQELSPQQETENASQLQQDRLADTLANPPKPKKPKPKVKLPWVGLSIALLADSWDIIELICNLATGGACLALTETIGNIIDWCTGAILLIWCLFYKDADTSLVIKIIGAMTAESIPGADPLPSWTGMIFWHYFKKKAQSKVPIPINFDKFKKIKP